MIIARAKPEDAPAIAQLIAEVLPLLTQFPDARGAEKFIASVSTEAITTYINAPNFLYRVGLIDNKLAGVVAMRDSTHLYHLFIAPAMQGRGLAKQLWHEAKEHAILTTQASTFTVNSSLFAAPVYCSFGFVPSGEKTEKDGVAYIPMMLQIGKNLSE